MFNKMNNKMCIDGLHVCCCVFALVEVVERSSPPAPVEILPSNAGQDIAPTQSTGKIKQSSFFIFPLFLF